MKFKELKSDLYLLACGIYIAVAIVFSSLWGGRPSMHLVFTAARGLCYLVICVKLLHDFITRQISLKSVLVMGAVGMFLLLSAQVSGNKNPLIYWVFIAAGHDVNYRRILKAALAGHVLGLLAVVGTCFAGLIEDVEFVRREGTVRASLGFTYSTAAANYFFYTALLWGAVRKREISYWELALMMAVNIFLFVRTDTKSAFLLTTLWAAVLLLMKLSDVLRRFRAWYLAPALLLVPLCIGFIVWTSAAYDPAVPWMARLNRFLSNRLLWGHAGLQNYGIRLLGQPITWVGMDGDYAQYNYVDSSFLQILLNFGPVFLLLTAAGLEAYAWRICRRQNIWLLAAFVFFVVHSTFDPQLILIGYNSFLLAWSFVADGGIQPMKEES